jgi:signal transduction histidine kinase
MGKMTKSKELIIAVFIFVSVIITTVILAVCAVSERENEKNMQRQLSAENKIQSVIETKSIEYLQETGEEDAEIVTDSSMLTENTKDTMKEAVKEISCWGDSMMEGCGKGFAVINNNGLYKDIDFCLKKSGNNIIIQVKNDVNYIEENQTQRMFDRFYRSDATTSKVKGYGLGLFIEQVVVLEHKGNISAKAAGEHEIIINAAISCK